MNHRGENRKFHRPEPGPRPGDYPRLTEFDLQMKTLQKALDMIDNLDPICRDADRNDKVILFDFQEVLIMECLMDHIVLNVVNEEIMMAFYAEILQMQPERIQEYRAGNVPFPSVRLNADTVIDLFPKKMWQENGQAEQVRKNLNHFCIALNKKEWETLLERLEASDVEIEEGPVPRWGAHGTGTSIYFRDPEGNIIEARYYDITNASEKCLLGS